MCGVHKLMGRQCFSCLLVLMFAVIMAAAYTNRNTSNIIHGEASSVVNLRRKPRFKGVVAIVQERRDRWWATCTGVLLRRDLVLTAGHCTDVSMVWAGSYNLVEGRRREGIHSRRHHVSHRIRHPHYQKILGTNEFCLQCNDVAMVWMQEPFPEWDYVDTRWFPLSPAAYPLTVAKLFMRRAIDEDDDCYMVGYGISDHGQPYDVMMEGRAIVREPQWCDNESHMGDHTGFIICTGFRNREELPVAGEGDSGGPLFCRDSDGEFKVAGILSTSYGKGGNSSHPQNPMKYVALYPIRDWIIDYIRN